MRILIVIVLPLPIVPFFIILFNLIIIIATLIKDDYSSFLNINDFDSNNKGADV